MNHGMHELLGALKALAEVTRIRIILVLSGGELNVTELTQILDQSQPRVSRHLKLLLEAGLITRHKEGNWVLFRLGETGVSAELARSIVRLIPVSEAVVAADLRRLQDVKSRRAETAAAYFSANAQNWQKLRSLHLDENKVESHIKAMIGREPVDTLVDLGTGTGRMLELFAGQAHRLVGIDLSREMLSYARSNLDQLNAAHAQVRQASLYALPLADASADVVILHQVLHFLDEPEAALREARRILKPAGKLLVVDFAPHELEDLRENDAHRRLGIPVEDLHRWFSKIGLAETRHETLPPPPTLNARGLTVTLTLARHHPFDARISQTETEAV
jgi:ubiquinone/menaquinone biosynthesis C-methylase UbiE/DNA-binding transcriptional ArsR family regulator